MGAVGIYQWLDNVLRTEYEEVRLLKQSGRGSVRLIRHRATGRRFILRRYSGEAEVYRKLLDYSCPNLPETLEVAVDARPGEGVRSLVLEEYVQGDTLDFLCGRPCSRRRRCARPPGSCAGPCGCSTPWGPSTGT